MTEYYNSDKMMEYDDDCPLLNEEQLEQLHQVVKERNRRKVKQTISMRLDLQSIDIAKQFGQGYTSILARILFVVLRTPKLLEYCLKEPDNGFERNYPQYSPRRYELDEILKEID